MNNMLLAFTVGSQAHLVIVSAQCCLPGSSSTAQILDTASATRLEQSQESGSWLTT